MSRSLLVAVGVVESEVMVLDVLRNAVNLDFGLVHQNFRVETSYRVDLTSEGLFFKKRPFADTDANVHSGGR